MTEMIDRSAQLSRSAADASKREYLFHQRVFAIQRVWYSCGLEVGALTFTQSFDRPATYSESSFFPTTPSSLFSTTALYSARPSSN